MRNPRQAGAPDTTLMHLMAATVPKPLAPRSRETRQRRHIAKMRCDDAELAQLEAAAEQAGLSIGAFLRHQAFGKAGPRATRRPPVERAALAQILGQLGKCGSNLNQIARSLNRGRDVPDDLPLVLAEVRQVAAAIVRMLGRGGA